MSPVCVFTLLLCSAADFLLESINSPSFKWSLSKYTSLYGETTKNYTCPHDNTTNTNTCGFLHWHALGHLKMGL